MRSKINGRKSVLKWPIWEHYVPFTSRNSKQNGPKLWIWERCVQLTVAEFETKQSIKCPIMEHTVPFTDRNLEPNSPKFVPNWAIWVKYVPFTDKNSEENGTAEKDSLPFTRKNWLVDSCRKWDASNPEWKFSTGLRSFHFHDFFSSPRSKAILASKLPFGKFGIYLSRNPVFSVRGDKLTLYFIFHPKFQDLFGKW